MSLEELRLQKQAIVEAERIESWCVNADAIGYAVTMLLDLGFTDIEFSVEGGCIYADGLKFTWGNCGSQWSFVGYALTKSLAYNLGGFFPALVAVLPVEPRRWWSWRRWVVWVEKKRAPELLQIVGDFVGGEVVALESIVFPEEVEVEA